MEITGKTKPEDRIIKVKLSTALLTSLIAVFIPFIAGCVFGLIIGMSIGKKDAVCLDRHKEYSVSEANAIDKEIKQAGVQIAGAGSDGYVRVWEGE